MDQKQSNEIQDDILKAEDCLEEYNEDEIQIVGQLNDSVPALANNDSLNLSKRSEKIQKAKKSGKLVQKTRIQPSRIPIQSEKDDPDYKFGKEIRYLYKQSKFKELVNFVQHDKSRYREFDAFKYHGEVFKLNQNVMVNNANNENDDYIGQIIKIIQIKEQKSQTFILISQVKWYYRKMEIVKSLPEHKSWISSNELFATDQTDYILTNAIYAHCSIVSLEDYEQLQDFDGIYFCRLKWVPLKNKILGFDLLPKHCICKVPINPELDYIQCDKCDEWYHMSCVGARKNEWEHREYICGRCR